MVPTCEEFVADDGARLECHFFPAESATPTPLVICIHGGGWISGDPSMMHDVALTLNRFGFSAACPQYRLAPLHTYPTAILDIQACVRHLREHAIRLHIEPAKIASLGNSAGGYLAAMCGLLEAEVNGISSKVNAVVDICGISDLTDPNDSHYPISLSFLEQFIGFPYIGNEEIWRKASPISHIEGCDVPFLLVHGEADEIVPIEQSKTLAGGLFAQGAKVSLHTFPSEGHSFTYSGWAKVEELFIAFLKQTFAGEFVA